MNWSTPFRPAFFSTSLAASILVACGLFADGSPEPVSQSGNNSPNTVLRANASDSEILLNWDSNAGHYYFIEASDDLIEWERVPVFTFGDGALMSVSMEPFQGTRFYRLLQTDDMESPLMKLDTVGNRIPDWWELYHYGYLGVDPSEDLDGDRLTNLMEYYFGKDPNEVDTDVSGVTPPLLRHIYATPHSVYLDWDKSLGLKRMSLYRVHRDGSKLLDVTLRYGKPHTTEITDASVSPGTTYVYEIQGRDGSHTWSVKSDSVEVMPPLQSQLPSPWSADDVGGYRQGPGRNAFNPDEERFVVAASTGEILYDFHFIHQVLEGDFSISSKVLAIEHKSEWSKAGLVVSENLTGNGRGVAYAFTAGHDAQILKVAEEGAAFSAVTTPGVRGQGWIRIDRNGDRFRFYASNDGKNWLRVREELLDLPESLHVGLAVATNSSQYGTGAFSEVEVESGAVEPGPDPRESDSDGDGLSDYEEMYILFSDPNRMDVGQVVVEQSLTGNQRTATLGSWAVVGDTLEARDERGWIEYSFSLPRDGMYRISLEVNELRNPTNENVHDFDFSINGHYTDRVRLFLDGSEPGYAQVITPHLSAGNHTLRVFWDNTLTYRRIAIHGLEVHHLEDLGWMDTRFDHLNGLLLDDEVVNETHVSPFVIEGWSKHTSLLDVVDGNGAPLEMTPLPGGHWMAQLPLDKTDTGAEAHVHMEHESRVRVVQARWVPYDVLSGNGEPTGPMYLRVNDSLRVTVGGLVAGRTGTITVSGPDDQTEIHHLTEGESAVALPFHAPGLYRINGLLSAVEGAAAVEGHMTVRVVEASLSGDLMLPTSIFHNWRHPDLGYVPDIEFDQRLALAEIDPIEGDRTFSVGTNDTRPLYVAARLPGGGAVLDVASVRGLKVAASLDTSITRIDSLPDGTIVTEMPVVVSDVVPGMEVRLEIVVNGITFDDGSLVKTLTAADFDALGRAKVRFLRNADTTTANCYALRVVLPGNAGAGE